MYELTVIQKKPSRASGTIFDEEQVYFFSSEDVEEMFNLIEILVKAARYETEYSIRVIEEGQVDGNEN